MELPKYKKTSDKIIANHDYIIYAYLRIILLNRNKELVDTYFILLFRTAFEDLFLSNTLLHTETRRPSFTHYHYIGGYIELSPTNTNMLPVQNKCYVRHRRRFHVILSSCPKA